MKQYLFGFIILEIMLANPFMTASAQPDSSKVEWIRAYFDMPADHAAALPGNRSKDNYDLMGTLVSLIDSATTSVDLCIYDLEQPRIGRALVRAKKRGLRVRLVTDNYNRDDSHKVDSLMWAMLRKGRVISIDDEGDVYMPDGSIFDNSLVNAGADMHNKFAIIDAMDDDPENDYVWTGSTNLTYTGAYNTNHTVVIKDNAMARRFTQEFEQMWGSSSDLPNPERARFHKDKRAGGHHIFYVGDARVELYFGPVNRTDTKPDIAKRMAEVVEKEAQHDVEFEAFAISANFPLSQKVWTLSARGAIQLEGVIGHLFYARYQNKGSYWASPEARRGNRLILPSNELRKLHNKVFIIDGANPDSTDQGVVFTGSYNFSNNANKNNDENSLIIYSDKLANQFYQGFRGVQNRAKGDSYPPAPPVYTKRWYKVDQEIKDGSFFTIDVVPGFAYNVRFLGVDVPAVYATNDSADYNAGKIRKYMQQLLEGASVKLTGPYGSKPDDRYGALHAYVTMRKEGKIKAINRKLLEDGMGKYAPYYSQHPDSAAAFKQYEKKARQLGRGIWAAPQKIGQKISRSEVMSRSSTTLADVLPVNINTAGPRLLQLLPGIGPSYAQRIIDYRNQHGGFSSVDELRKVEGIGPKTLVEIRPDVVTEK